MKNINECVAVTGHRVVKKDFNVEELEKEINLLIEKGCKYFFVGMALGFDSICFEILYKIKQKKDVKIIACLPCKEQDSLWNSVQKEVYRKNLKKADEIVIMSDEYDNACMQKRNRYMVDNSAYLIAYLYRSSGGAYNTVKYAIENKKEVIYIK